MGVIMQEDKKKVFLLAGHAQSGKTSISEAILFKCGAISRLGKVEEGNTVSDYEEDEKERKSSVNMSFLHSQYQDNFLQFIDTPGYLDFIGELISASRVVDFGIIVIDAANGIEVGTEKAWEILRKENLPCIFLINKLDKENTDFNKVVLEIQNTFTKKAVPFAFFENGKIVDVLNKKDSNFYSEIVDAVVETDDKLLEKYLEKGQIEETELNNALKKAIINSLIFPILPCIATTTLGIENLIKVITEIMPSPFESLPKKVIDLKTNELVDIKIDLNKEFLAFVFKTIIDPFVGQLNIFRVFGGKLVPNTDVYNVTKREKEKISQIYILQGKQQIQRDVIFAGEIGAVAKLKNTSAEDTVSVNSNSFKFLPIEFPPPSYSASVKPKTRQDEDKISVALSRLTSEDRTFTVSREPQTNELLISGMGELHLNVIIDRMRRRYSANVELGTPKVPYKETITKSVKVQGKYKRQTGGRGQYGDVWIEVEPLERGKGFEFVDKIFGGAIPKNFIPSVEKGIRKALEEGLLAGYPVVDLRVILYDGSYHPVDSSDIAFQIAGSMAIKKALLEAGSVLLEPIMNVEISIPDEFMGQITGDINSKRGRVLGVEAKGKNQIVKAQIPLSEMFKYASDLRSVTGGRGSYIMSFSHYEIVPVRLAENIIKEAQKNRKVEEGQEEQ